MLTTNKKNRKSVYIIFQTIKSTSGISKKIHAQVKALNNIGIKTSLVYFKDDSNGRFSSRYIDSSLIEEFNSNIKFFKKHKWRYSFKRIFNHIVAHKYDFIYIRYTYFANPFFILFLKKIKKTNTKIILEIPTYPYDQEHRFVPFVKRPLIYMERIFRRYFKYCLDFIITFSNEKAIFGVPTININNGVDLKKIPMRKLCDKRDCINLVAVGSMEFWHGFDRIIIGLSNYYKQNPQLKINLHLVGDSNNEESKHYHFLVEQLNLSQNVYFHGFKYGEELDNIFNLSDFAIGSLGRHRTGISNMKSLKNSEYCSRGIPFLYSENDDTFDDKDFILKVPADDSPVKIDDIITFLSGYNIPPEDLRSFAIKNLSWEIQMSKIVKELDRYTLSKS